MGSGEELAGQSILGLCLSPDHQYYFPQMSEQSERSHLSPRMKEIQRRIDSASPNRTGAVSKSYQEGWDRIFKNKVKSNKKDGKE